MATKRAFDGRIFAHDVLAYIPWDGELWVITVGFRGSVVWAPEACVVYPLGFTTDAPWREPTYLEIRELYDARDFWERWAIDHHQNVGPLGFRERLQINLAKDHQELDLLYRLLDRIRWDKRQVIAAWKATWRSLIPRQAVTDEQRLELREALKNWLR